MKKTRTQLKATAYHEAGHAVIGRVLTLSCGRATIKPDRAEAGHALTDDPHSCLHEWEKRGKVREKGNAVWHARIMTYMAGAEAEMELLGSKAAGDWEDRRQIRLMANSQGFNDDPDEWETKEARLRAMMRMLVRRHKVRIERVAKALLAKTTLSAKALDKLVGRSVDDVKVNALYLPEMHRRAAG